MDYSRKNPYIRGGEVMVCPGVKIALSGGSKLCKFVRQGGLNCLSGVKIVFNWTDVQGVNILCTGVTCPGA